MERAIGIYNKYEIASKIKDLYHPRNILVYRRFLMDKTARRTEV